ncbi:GNAT family N-acetyltransferase [Streptomyces sp. WI04-05B]|uniref:GNAT family N-acetyltransferase n=1 Tax=Streptomyces TaxID=1883 RepID=UPI0029AFA7A5|nr:MULTISPECIES: GNAT family N-acetyltransferase [unclassified Streptomyces]MDX2541224.1 GNAT family N-acetyltransferase [Streptomyces sp. WI04-05B]MDX2585546.1 GNAT family N-acetyltransferase [Streptomyces sp. WI04-05A]
MEDDLALRVHERLAACPGLRPVGAAEGHRFDLWDLASLAEGALGECADPDSLTASHEKRLRLRLGATGRAHAHNDDYCRRYWIRDPSEDTGGGRPRGPLGTVAVDTWPSGVGSLRVSSLYVHPVARRRGLASSTLDTVYEACRAEGLHGFRLDTCWTWQRSVRYYLNRGLWVTSWKRALGLARLSYLPRYEVRETEGELTFLVADPEANAPGAAVPLLVAGAADGRLRLRETERYARTRDELNAVRHYALSTLALHLAVRGLPLVRGEEEWAEALAGRWCDIGDPEGLARRIEAFEQVARDDGWRLTGLYGRSSHSRRD